MPRYGIDNSRRTKHGALLDAEILAEVYVELIGARQATLGLVENGRRSRATRQRGRWCRVRPAPLAAAPHRRRARGARGLHRDARRERDLAEYLRRSVKLLSGGASACGGGVLRLRCAMLLAVERDEIDRVEQQRREAAVAHRVGDDLAREREQQPRAFDHHERLQVLLRHVLDAEHAGKDQLEAEQHVALDLGLAFELAARPR